MFSMFLDVCKNLIDYIRKLWISSGGIDRNSRGIIKYRLLIIFVVVEFVCGDLIIQLWGAIQVGLWEGGGLRLNFLGV